MVALSLTGDLWGGDLKNLAFSRLWEYEEQVINISNVIFGSDRESGPPGTRSFLLPRSGRRR